MNFEFICVYLLLIAMAAVGFADAPLLRGVVLIPDEAELLAPEAAAAMEGIHTERIAPPGKRTELEALLAPFCNAAPIQPVLLSQIKKAIHSYYIDHRQPFVLVSVPAQNISGGILQLVIAPSKLDQVHVKGGGGAPVDRLLSLEAGNEIEPEPLQKNLNFFNRNPFRRAEVVFSPGSRPRTTDITFLVQEERPVRFFAGADNSGVPSIAEGRVFSGVHFNAMQGVLVGSFLYNASYDFRRFQSWAGSCTSFLPWKHIIKLSGSYAWIHPDTTDFKVKNRGMSDQVAFRYAIPSLDSEMSRRDFSFGFDFKQMSNVLEYAIAAPVYSEAKLVTVSQIVAGYFFSLEAPAWNLEAEINGYFSPGGFFPHQSKGDFTNMRAGARSLYAYANGSFKMMRKFRSGTASLSFSAQTATGPLIPSEQMGLGGYGSVRGYDAGQYNADQALLASMEWAFPSWPFTSFFSGKKGGDAMHFLLFADGGCGANGDESQYLLGIGSGLRYTFAPYLSARLDLGFRLHEEAAFTGDFYKWHFNLTGSY